MAYLKHFFNGNTVSVYELSEKVTIGRHVDNNIAIDDPIVSGFHAELELIESQYILVDLDSTNGSYFKGKAVKSVKLDSGDIFSIGPHEFELSEKLPDDLDKTLKIKKSWIPGIYYTE